MSLFSILAFLFALCAALSYINHRLLRLPTTIGVMMLALLGSLVVNVLDVAGFQLAHWAPVVLKHLDFPELLLDIMLAFLLFAGALHIPLDDLLEQTGVVSLLATVGVLMSTFLVGGAMWWILHLLGHPFAFIYCLLFGALISPTDPIAVLGILKSAGAPRSLEMKIAGESLFNDGIGVVVFSILFDMVRAQHGDAGAHHVQAMGMITFLLQEVVGAGILGFICGYIAYRMLRSVDNYQVEVLITLALAMGVYALAQALHSSGPLAVVVAGLFIGNIGRTFAMSEMVREHVDTFWELIDEILNVLLFVLIGLEVLIIPFTWSYLALGALAIPLVLMARFLAVGGVVSVLKLQRDFTPHAVKIMSWGGLRGGISVALALSLPAAWGMARDVTLALTYPVVAFSIIVQGLSVGWLVRQMLASSNMDTSAYER